MESKLIARQRECDELVKCLDSDKSEFVIICGRRRIGKTYLVDKFFPDFINASPKSPGQYAL